MLSTCRFNEQTWNENCVYREKHNIEGPIYGVPMQMRNTIELDILVFVVEMNNAKNKIEGIGLIKNKIETVQKYYVYSEQNYNRYIYKGEYRLDRKILQSYNLKLVEILDYILFKGKTHLKRVNGFMRIPDKLLGIGAVAGAVAGAGLKLFEEIKTIFLRHFNKE